MNFDDLAKLIPNAAWRLREDDTDPQETREWLEALDAVIDAVGPERATFVLKHLLQHARTRRVPLPQVLNTPYLNTISLADQPPFPGNLEIESRLSALVRWNALAMVVRANAVSAGARWPYRELFVGRRSVRSRLQSFLSRKLERIARRPGLLSTSLVARCLCACISRGTIERGAARPLSARNTAARV